MSGHGGCPISINLHFKITIMLIILQFNKKNNRKKHGCDTSVNNLVNENPQQPKCTGKVAVCPLHKKKEKVCSWAV
jgi:hypothetical protein